VTNDACIALKLLRRERFRSIQARCHNRVQCALQVYWSFCYIKTLFYRKFMTHQMSL